MSNRTSSANVEKQEDKHEIKQVTSASLGDGTMMIYCLTTKGEILAYRDKATDRPMNTLEKVIHVN